MNYITVENANYIAGLFDGEGHTRLATYRATKNGKIYKRIVVSIVNNDFNVLLWVKLTLGIGHVVTNGKRTLNKKGELKDQSYKFQLYCNQAREFLDFIYPFVRIKKQQIEKVFALIA